MIGNVGDESVQLQPWPVPDDEWRDSELEGIYQKLLAVRELATKALEEKRARKEIGTSLEAAVKVTLPSSRADIFLEREASLPMFFIVSQVELEVSSEEEEVRVEVEKAPGKKCSRCWNYRTSVGQDASHPEICDRCLPVVLDASAT